MKSTLKTDGYMWIISYQFHGSWLDIEAINSILLGSLLYLSSDHGDQEIKYEL